LDEVGVLRSWLVGEDELRGRVELVERPPHPGALGPVLDSLLVALAPGGAASVLMAGFIAWVRSRNGDIDITAERHDGRAMVGVSARRVRGLDADGMRAEIASLGRTLSDGFPSADIDGPPP
jgi:hypothetical protein